MNMNANFDARLSGGAATCAKDTFSGPTGGAAQNAVSGDAGPPRSPDAIERLLFCFGCDVLVERLQPIANFVAQTLRGVGQVGFCDRPLSGLLQLAAVFLGAPWLAALALLGSATATAAGHAFRIDAPTLRGGPVASGLVQYNAVLLGMGFGIYLGFPAWSWQPVAATVAGSACMPLLTLALSHLTRPTPGYTWAYNFCLITVLLKTRPFSQTTGAAEELQLTWDEYVKAVPIGISQVFFINSWLVGVLIILAVALQSRRLAASFVLGSAVGLLTGACTGAPADALRQGLRGYESALTAASICMWFDFNRFFLPFTVFAAAGTEILTDGLEPAFALLGVPCCTVPFCIAASLCFAVRGAMPQLVASEAEEATVTDPHSDLESASPDVPCAHSDSVDDMKFAANATSDVELALRNEIEINEVSTDSTQSDNARSLRHAVLS